MRERVGIAKKDCRDCSSWTVEGAKELSLSRSGFVTAMGRQNTKPNKTDAFAVHVLVHRELITPMPRSPERE